MRSIITSADISQESGIIRTAGHSHTSGNKEFASHSTGLHHTALKAYDFSHIGIRIIHGIYKPDSIILRGYLHNRCIDVKGQLILENILHFPFFILKNNLCTLIGNLNSPSVCRQRISLFTAVKNNHVCISDHIHKQRFHICHVHLVGSGIYTGDLLFNPPAFRQFHLFKFAHKPHSIVFYNHTVRLMDNIHSSQTLRCKVILFLDHLNYCVCKLQFFLVIFLFSLFTEDQQSFSINGKILLLQCKIQESGLSAFQKTGNEINGNLDIFHNIISFNLLFLQHH